MKRKVIKQANQAYTITLPIDWVRKNSIDKNNEVDIIVKEKVLIINSDNPVVGGKAKVDINNLCSKSIYRVLISLYAKGIDEIELICREDKTQKIIRFLNNLLGYALVEQKEDVYVIKDLKCGETKNLDEVFKRVFQMILNFYESAIKDIFGERKETLEGTVARDFEVNKFSLFLQRAINKMSYSKSIKGRALFTYSFELERVGDEINRLWKTSIKHKIKLNKQIQDLAKLSLEALGAAFEFYYQFNPKKIKKVYDLRDKVRKNSMKLTKLDTMTMRFVRHIINISEYAADFSHLALLMNL